jgi:hypothetical protein
VNQGTRFGLDRGQGVGLTATKCGLALLREGSHIAYCHSTGQEMHGETADADEVDEPKRLSR